jgi:putrescine aminotransferase
MTLIGHDPLETALTAGETPEQVEARIQEVVELSRDHLNPGLGKLMQFAGFGDIEEFADGCVVTTASGTRFLDFLGGYGVFSLGHRNPRVVAAVHRQLDRMPLSLRTFFNEQAARLAGKLAEIAPAGLEYTFFSNSGTEAVEAALKMARVTTGRTDFVSTIGSYHGKTMGALSATGREKYRTPFGPLVPGFSHVPFNDVEAVRAAVTDRTAAIIIEPIQGEGGIIVPDDGYLTALRAICDESGALLIADEVQTGFGRTGRMFGVDHEGVRPDIMTLAKALGGGVMPIGATMGTAEVWQKTFGENPLLHTSTFGGNPLACAAGLEAIAVIQDEDLCALSCERGALLMAGLKGVQEAAPGAIVEVRGRALMIGVEFAVKDVAELAINAMARRGVVAAYTLNNPKVIRFEPPLIITPEQIEFGVAAFREAVQEAVAMLEGMEE